MVKHPSLNSLVVLLSTDSRFPSVNLSELKAKFNIVYTEIEMSSGEINNAKAFGGNNDDYGVSLDFDKYRSYVLAGYSTSSDFPLSYNANQSNYNSGKDIIIVRNGIGNLTLQNPSTNRSLCSGSDVVISWSAEVIEAKDGYNIGYSFDDKHDIFIPIASNVTTESYNWTVPAELSGKKNVIIRVTHNSGLFAQNIDYYEVNEKATLTSFNLSTPDTICIGDEIKLNATVKGVDVQYTWFKDNIEIGKTSTNEFTISNATIKNSGKYKVSIVNDCPPAEESKAIINVYVSPDTKAGSITENNIKNKGETLELTTNSLGVGLKYIWQKDGKNLPSQNKKTLTLSNLSLNDAGSYRCLIEGKCGIDSTNEASVVINDVIGSVSNSITEIAKIYEESSNIYSIEFMNISNYTYSVYDNLGNILVESNSNSNTNVDLNAYSNGIYWLVITKGDKTYREKLIKIN